MTVETEKVYQLKIQLEDIKPPIWRRFIVSNTISLELLHLAVQIIMGWEDYHLHQFVKGNARYGTVDPEWEDSTINESDFVIGDLLGNEGDHIIYEYDFGDGWGHKIILEKILPLDKKQVLPSCIKGVRSCPPEDVGGVWGYEEFLEALRDEKHHEHKAMKDWAGGDFDPERFDLGKINRALASVFKDACNKDKMT